MHLVVPWTTSAGEVLPSTVSSSRRSGQLHMLHVPTVVTSVTSACGSLPSTVAAPSSALHRSLRLPSTSSSAATGTVFDGAPSLHPSYASLLDGATPGSLLSATLQLPDSVDVLSASSSSSASSSGSGASSLASAPLTVDGVVLVYHAGRDGSTPLSATVRFAQPGLPQPTVPAQPSGPAQTSRTSQATSITAEPLSAAPPPAPTPLHFAEWVSPSSISVSRIAPGELLAIPCRLNILTQASMRLAVAASVSIAARPLSTPGDNTGSKQAGPGVDGTTIVTPVNAASLLQVHGREVVSTATGNSSRGDSDASSTSSGDFSSHGSAAAALLAHRQSSVPLPV